MPAVFAETLFPFPSVIVTYVVFPLLTVNVPATVGVTVNEVVELLDVLEIEEKMEKVIWVQKKSHKIKRYYWKETLRWSDPIVSKFYFVKSRNSRQMHRSICSKL